MSYKVLARKWRPQRFEDMLGQESVLRALVGALDTDRLHHAYLFTGMRGVGKTTIARIFAKCLNCLENGVSSTPCGQCSTCRDIEAGRFLDLIEVDAASRTKVEETRELLENVPYAPASGRYKVYLIDEVHMFSNSSFNALLKTLEEPPEHVKFLLATTDPQKVPVTVLSRCLQFNLRRMAPDALADYLAGILEQESIEAEPAALALIARASEGSVRDSLSLVEQAAAFGEGAVRAVDVEAMLGRVSIGRLVGLLDALAHGDVATLFARVEALAEYAPDFGELLGELLSLLHRLALMQSLADGGDASQPGHEALASLAERVTPEDVQLWYQIGLHARRDLPFAPDPREAFDMALLRLHAFRPQGTDSGPMPGATTPRAPATRSPTSPVDDASSAPGDVAIADTATVLEAGSEANATNAKAGNAAPAEAASPPRLAVHDPSGSGSAEASPPAAPSMSVPQPAVPVPVIDPASPSAQASSAPTVTGSLDALSADTWSAVVSGLKLSGMPAMLATHSTIAGRNGTRLTLSLEAAQEHLAAPQFVTRVADALGRWAGVAVTVEVELADGDVDTPARREQVSEAAALDEARRAIATDDKLKRLLDDLDGTVDEASVRPVQPRSGA